MLLQWAYPECFLTVGAFLNSAQCLLALPFLYLHLYFPITLL
jgi:hypothetical protein